MSRQPEVNELTARVNDYKLRVGAWKILNGVETAGNIAETLWRDAKSSFLR